MVQHLHEDIDKSPAKVLIQLVNEKQHFVMMPCHDACHSMIDTFVVYPGDRFGRTRCMKTSS
jgi:hypothetical protein